MLKHLLLWISITGLSLFADQALARDTERAILHMFGPAAPYKAFFLQLQQAAREHDRETMLNMIEYPLHVQSQPPRLLDEAALREQFDRIFDERLLGLLREQQFDQLQISNAGLAFGRGDLWFGGVCSDASCEPLQIKILRIGRDERGERQERNQQAMRRQ